MKVCRLTLLFTCCLFISPVALAQHEWETVYNPRTGERERQFNPWNQAQRAYEMEQERLREEQLRQRHDQSMREINERYNRYEEQRNAMMQQQQQFWRNLMLNQQQLMIELNARRNYGEGIIKAGKATVTYKPNPTFSLKNHFLQKATSPELKQLVEQYAELCLKQFREELRVRGLAQNDYADARALAFVICYEVYFGEKPSAAHLTMARQLAREHYLKDAIFQSYNDSERQLRAEPDGAMAMYARLLMVKGDAASLREAKSVAKSILEPLWGNDVSTILMTQTSFIHKGKQVIADGKATHIYRYNPSLPTAAMKASANSLHRANITQENQRRLQLFYQVLTQKGGQKNDLAWCATLAAYAEYYVLSNGQEWTPKQFQSVYEFTKAAILKSPDVQAASDESKQIACEYFAIDAVGHYLDFAQPTARGVAIASARVALGKLFRALNEDPNHYQFTAQGIVPVAAK